MFMISMIKWIDRNHKNHDHLRSLNHFNMKTLLLILALASFSGRDIMAQNNTTMKTQNEDSAAIASALEEVYFKGIYEGDVALLQKLYHPGTLLFGDIKGVPYAKTLEQYLDGVAHRQSPKDSGKPFRGEITAIDVVNSIAMAKVKVKMYDFHYDEFLSFHKIDGRWLIVNKMITDIQN
jgi:hypothetical protein